MTSFIESSTTKSPTIEITITDVTHKSEFGRLKELIFTKEAMVWQAIHNKAQTLYHSVRDSSIYCTVRAKYEELSPKVCAAMHKVSGTALPILWGTTAFFLLTAQSSLFSVGVLSGVLAPTFMQKGIDQIHEAWSNQTLPVKALIVGGSVIAWPISLAASAVFVGASVGISLQKSVPKLMTPST